MKLMRLALFVTLTFHTSSGIAHVPKHHYKNKPTKVTRHDARQISNIINMLVGNSSRPRSKQFTAVTNKLNFNSEKASSEFTTAVGALVTEAVNSLKASTETSQKLLDNLYEEWRSCKLEQTTWTSEEKIISFAKDHHKTCRSGEAQIVTESSTCDTLLDTLRSSKETFCSQAEEYSPSSQACEAMAGESYLAYVRRMADYWSTQESVFERLHTQCEAAKEDLASNETKCAALKTGFSQKKEECDSFNMEFNTASCDLATRQQTTCSTYASCYDDKSSAYVEGEEEVGAEETEFKLEYTALKHIDCLLAAMEADPTVQQAKIDECLATEIDTSELDMQYHVIDPAESCTLPAVYPCNEDFFDQEFSDMPEGTAAICEPCVSQAKPAMPVADTGLTCTASTEYNNLPCTNVFKDSNDLVWDAAGSNTWAANGREKCEGTWIEIKLPELYTVEKVEYRQRFLPQDQAKKMLVELKSESGSILTSKEVKFQHVNQQNAPAEEFVLERTKDVKSVRFTMTKKGPSSNCWPNGYLGAKRIRILGIPASEDKPLNLPVPTTTTTTTLPPPPPAAVNLALNKPTFTSNGHWSHYDGKYATDGFTCNRISANNCGVAHTLAMYEAWIETDLGAPQAIDHVIIYNGWEHCCRERINPYVLILYDDQKTEVWRSASLRMNPSIQYEAMEIDTSAAPPSRYVRVQLDGHSNYLHIAELEAWTAGTKAL